MTYAQESDIHFPAVAEMKNTKTGKISFSDVPESAWFYDEVNYVNDKGIMTGMREGYFGATSILSRAQFATILYRMSGSEPVEYEKKYPDVPQGTFYTDAVMWASKNGIITGYTEGPTAGRFGASDSITREQMAVMMYRYARFMGVDTSYIEDVSTFPDGKKTSEFAREALGWAIESGLITGNADGTLAPQGTASRAVCATIIMRYMKKIEEPSGKAVTREEWIVSLMEILGKEKDINIDGYTFKEHEEVDSPELIETAYRWDMIPVVSDNDDEILFNPDGPATREFIAYSVIHGMGYELKEEDVTWDDRRECLYPIEDLLAVDLELLSVENNRFIPGGTITGDQKDNILQHIKELSEGPSGNNDEIIYAEGVKESTLDFELDKANQEISVPDANIAQDWKSGEIHTLINESEPENSIAIRVESVESTGTGAKIHYSTPEFNEVISSIDVSGSVSQQGTFTPAEDVDILESAATRASANGEIPLSKSFKFSKKIDINGKKVELLQGKIGIDSLDYKFDVDAGFFLPDVNRVYLALNNSAHITSNIKLSDLVGDDALNYEFTIGSFQIPVGYVFIVRGNVNVIVNIDGSFSLDYEFTNVSGIDYNKGRFKTIFDIDSDLKELSLEAEMKAGFEFEPEVTFLGLNLASVGAELGRSFKGELDVVQVSPFLFCLDGSSYIYANISGKILSGLMKFEKPILTKQNNFGGLHFHFEEEGVVDECTRGKGDYKGKIVNKETQEPLQNIQVVLLKGDQEVDRTVSGEDGSFSGNKIIKGEYTILIQEKGYQDYREDIQIESNKTYDLKKIELVPQISVIASGSIIDYYSQKDISEAAIQIDGDTIVYSDENGDFDFETTEGKHTLSITKEGYVSKTIEIEVDEYGYFENSYIELVPDYGTTLTIHEGETIRLKQQNATKSSKLNYLIIALEDTTYDIAHYGGGFYALGLDMYYSGSALNDCEHSKEASPYEDYLYLYNDITVKSGVMQIVFTDSSNNPIDATNLVSIEHLDKPALAEYHILPGESLIIDGSILDNIIYDGSLYYVLTLPGTKGENITIWNNSDSEPSKEEIDYPWAASPESGNSTEIYTCFEGEIVVYIARDDIGRIMNVTLE